jgi:predicted pyridoxine 5'-phosphate oxidase superfamily flavin-nucleotide-binding protein
MSFRKETKIAQKKFGTFKKKYLKTLEAEEKKNLSEHQIQTIRKLKFLFLGTSTKSGYNSVSIKSIKNSIIKINKKELIIKNWMGDGKFISIGNILHNKNTSLLFVNFKKKIRIRIEAHAYIKKIKKQKFGIEKHDSIIRFKFNKVWVNCPRYL